MDPGDKLLSRLRRPRTQLVLCLLWAALLFLYLRQWSLTRDLDLRLRFEEVGRAWTIDWSPALSLPRNGHWIDLADRFAQDPTRPLTTPGPEDKIRVRLANYPLDQVALRWIDGRDGGRVTVYHASVTDKVLGFKMRTRPLALLRADGGQLDAPIRTSSPSPTNTDATFPVTFHCDAPSGGLHFPAPSIPWWYQLPVAALSLALAIATWAALRTLAWLAALYDRRTAHLTQPARTPRWLLITAAIAIFGIPLWLASWAPMLISGDSVPYILYAKRLLENGTFEHYNGWRLPGYAMLILPFFALTANYAIGIAWAQAAMSLATPLLAWATLHRRVPKPWPMIAALAVAIDPALFLWQRAVLTEAQTTFLITLGAFLFVQCADRVQHARGRPLAWALPLGLTLAAAAYTRPNIQVFAVLAPLALATIAHLAGRVRMICPAAICALTTAACLAPLVALNIRKFSTTSLTASTDWNRAVWSWENGTMDWSQSGVLSFEQFLTIRAKIKGHQFRWWDLPQHLQRWQTPPVESGLHWRTQMNLRCGVFWRESAARRANTNLDILPRALVSMFGVRTRSPWYFHGEPYFALGPILADSTDSDKHGQTNMLLDTSEWAPQDEDAINRARVPIGDVADSAPARFLKVYMGAWMIARPVIAGLFLFALVRLIHTKSYGLAAAGVILLVHMIAVPLMVFTGSDRYAMPWYGVMTVVMVAGFAVGRAGSTSVDNAQPYGL